MGYRSALLLTLLSALGSAQTESDPVTTVRGPLAVSLRDDRNASTGVLNALRREVEVIMAQSSIRIAWLSPETAQRNATTRLAVIHLIGQCRSDSPTPSASRFAKFDGEPLGQTHVVDGKVLPFADVRCDAVQRLIESKLQRLPDLERERVLGRALGRIVAHELYHVLLQTRGHAHDGLSRPAQTSAELVASRSRFGGEDERQLSRSEPALVDLNGVGTGR